jgi:hypothetical protein
MRREAQLNQEIAAFVISKVIWSESQSTSLKAPVSEAKGTCLWECSIFVMNTTLAPFGSG